MNNWDKRRRKVSNDANVTPPMFDTQPQSTQLLFAPLFRLCAKTQLRKWKRNNQASVFTAAITTLWIIVEVVSRGVSPVCFWIIMDFTVQKWVQQRMSCDIRLLHPVKDRHSAVGGGPMNTGVQVWSNIIRRHLASPSGLSMQGNLFNYCVVKHILYIYCHNCRLSI